MGNYKKFCSKSCASSHHIVSQEQKEKTRNTLKKTWKYKQYICKVCGCSYTSKQSKSKVFCSLQCRQQNYRNYRKYNKTQCQRLSYIAKSRHYRTE